MGGGEAEEDDQLGGARWTSSDPSKLTLRWKECQKCFRFCAWSKYTVSDLNDVFAKVTDQQNAV